MKIKKYVLYYKALYKKELLKKIEYKFKNIIGYFYIRNKVNKIPSNLKLNDINLNIKGNELKEKYTDNDTIKIFNEYSSYKEMITKLTTENVFWRKIDLKKYKDIKIIWEYNRLQFLVPIAIKYKKTNNKKYKEYIENIIDYWEKNNKYEYSVNWNNNLEVAIRALNISLTLMILSDDELNKKYTELLYLHAKYISNEMDYSDCCIPNNHVIGEATALLLLSRIIDIKKSNKWYKKSSLILSKYLTIIDEDGLSKENSFTYQWFVTKMYILSLCFINDKELFNKINNTINKSLNVLNFIYADNNTYLNYGDNDDGYLYSIYEEYNLINDIKEYYDLFINNKINDETLILNKILNKFNGNKINNNIEKKSKEYFYNKKIFIYNSNNNLVFFNAKNIEGHAHNDSLAINLIINNKNIIMDSGTYSYNLNAKERSYFRGRESHSTIQLNNPNAIEIGTFRWINKIESYIDKVIETKDYIKVIGVIENIASREIRIYKNINKIEIIDKINEDKLITNWIVSNNSTMSKDIINIENIKIKFNKTDILKEEKTMISKSYLVKEDAKKYIVESNKELETLIEW